MNVLDKIRRQTLTYDNNHPSQIGGPHVEVKIDEFCEVVQ